MGGDGTRSFAENRLDDRGGIPLSSTSTAALSTSRSTSTTKKCYANCGNGRASWDLVSVPRLVNLQFSQLDFAIPIHNKSAVLDPSWLAPSFLGREDPINYLLG